MTPATRTIAGVLAGVAVSAPVLLVQPAAHSTPLAAVLAASVAPPRAGGIPPASGSSPDGRLVVTIDRLRSSTLVRGRPLVVHGTVQNPSDEPRMKVQAYAQISPEPVTTLDGLAAFADIPDDTGSGNPDLLPGEYARLGTVPPGEAGHFVIRIPYGHLVISRAPGVYRVGIKVIATTPAGVRDQTDAARANTLLPLLPVRTRALVPVQTLTLLPLTAPASRLTGGPFADNTLVSLLAEGGRLSDVVAWALQAAPDTVQIVIDPALLAAVRDMSDGYRVQRPAGAPVAAGAHGRVVALRWLTHFERLSDEQHVLLLPWGEPAANSLLDNHLPGPVMAAVEASADFQSTQRVGTGVVGWLSAGRSGARALTVLRQAGAGAQIVSQACLPGLIADPASPHPPLSRLDVRVGRQRVPTLVVAPRLAGLSTTSDTSPLQFRQRLLAETTVRSMTGQTNRIAITALPFDWNPGPTATGQDLASAFASPVIVAQSVLGALDRVGTPYDGQVRPPGPPAALGPAVLTAVRDLSVAGGNLASILRPSVVAERAFQRAFAMSGSAQWVTQPEMGATLIERLAAADHSALAKVTVTGPPFVAMSSDSGRFPLTVTNGLDKPISVGLAVLPENPALSIAPLPTISLPAGQRRDIQVVSTADGSGVTSVRARLATLAGTPFGSAWRFDVRATQIGLVIWIVMGVGGVVLFTAAGYRIVNRLRGNGSPRRQTSA